jgi:hypothetical protein
VLVGASLMATSRGSAATPGLHINLAGQIKAASRAAAYLPGTMSLTGRITTRSDARCVSLPPPPRSVLTGWARATSGAAAYATTTSVRTRQNDVSVITS